MINLLPPKRLLNMRTARTNTILRRYIHLVLLGMVVVFAAIGSAYYFLQHRQSNVQTVLQEHQKKVSELEPLQKEAESLSVTVDTISNLFSRNIVFSEMLRKIGATMPAGAVLTGMQFSIDAANAPFIISAEVEDEQIAAVLRNNLAQSGLFESVEIKSITRNKEDEAPSSVAPPTEATEQQSEAGDAAQPAPQKESRYKFTTIINTQLKAVGASQ